MGSIVHIIVLLLAPAYAWDGPACSLRFPSSLFPFGLCGREYEMFRLDESVGRGHVSVTYRGEDRMVTRFWFYKGFALLMSVTLLATLIPLPVWAATATRRGALVTPESALATQTQPAPAIAATTPLSPSQAPFVDLTALTGPAGAPATLLNATPPTPTTALSVGRAQSAYAADAAPDHTLVVTFTVANQLNPLLTPTLNPAATITETIDAMRAVDYAADPNTLRNVILTDEFLPPQAEVLSTSLPANRQGNVWVWNLGDISPLGRVAFTLTLAIPTSVLDFTPLDTGATAWGTLAGIAVTAQAAPLSLAPDGFQGWLTCTIDANCQDSYVLKQAAELGGDPAALFAFVQSLRYESYTGSLRGARGTLWSAAGNSMDKASLLIALLRANGIPASYRHGTLSEALAQSVILSMFPDLAGVGGYITSDAFTADPANADVLLAEASDHWWVQAYLPGLGWTHLDPTIPGAAIGDFFVPLPQPEQLAELPDHVRHKVTLKLKVEEHHPLNFGGDGPGLANTYPLSVTFNTVELIGEPVTLQHLVETESAFGFFYAVQHFYTPLLIVGENQRVIEGTPYQELFSNFPFGTFLVSAAWLIFELSSPTGAVEEHTRELFDFIGPEARLNGGTVTADFSERATQPAMSMVTTYTTLFAPSRVVSDVVNDQYEAMTGVVEENMPALDAIQDLEEEGAEPTEADVPRLLEAQRAVANIAAVSQRLHLLTYAAASDVGLERLNETYLVHGYYDKPRILTVAWEQDPIEATNTIRFDLRQNSVRAVGYPGQSWTGLQAFNFSRGVLEASLEGLLLEEFAPGDGVSSVHHIFQAAEAQGIPLTIITPANLFDLDDLPISAEAKARIAASLLDPTQIVVVPAGMVLLNDSETIAWYEIDVLTGETIDVMEDGQHQALVEYAMLQQSSVNEFAFAVIGFLHGFAVYGLAFLSFIMERMPFDEVDLKSAWNESVEEATNKVIKVAEAIGFALDMFGDCFAHTPVEDAVGYLGAYIGGAGWELSIELDFGELSESWDDLDDALDVPDYLECIGVPISGPGSDVGGSQVIVGGDVDDLSLKFQVNVGGFVNGANLAKGIIGNVDPALPPALFARVESAPAASTVVRESITPVPTIPGRGVTANLTTASHTRFVGEGEWAYTTAGEPTWNVTNLAVEEATLYDANGAALGSGGLSAIALDDPFRAQGDGAPLTVVGATQGPLALYAPALTPLVGGSLWESYALTLSADHPFTLTLQAAQVTLEGGQLFSGTLHLTTDSPVTLAGRGPSAAPDFAATLAGVLTDATLSLGPAVGSLVVDGQAVDPSQGVALAAYSGAVDVTSITPAEDAVVLDGAAHFFRLTAEPATSTTLPNQAATFQAALATNYNDTYTVTVSAPAGWDVTLDAAGQVTLTPPLSALPGVYAIALTAQSVLYPTALVTAEHVVTLGQVDGVALDIRPDPIFTIPWGPRAPGASDSDVSQGRMQLTGAGYTVWLTNTSNIARDFTLTVSGLDPAWMSLGGQTGASSLSLALSAGQAVGVGLYLSPTLTALPPAGTQYPFLADATASDNPAVSASDADHFTIPAVAFNYLTVVPAAQLAAPGVTRTLEVALTNLGNAAGVFPLTPTVPVDWSVTGIQSPVSLAAGETATQSVTVSIPATAMVGEIGQVTWVSSASGSEFVQRASASIQVVSAYVLPVYEAAQDTANTCAVAGHTLSLPAALSFLAISMDDLAQSCASSACGLDLRDQTVSAAVGVANAAETISPLVTADAALQSLAAAMATHSTEADLLADNSALSEAVETLREEVCGVAQHQVTARFVPGSVVVLQDAPAQYALELTNAGSLPSTVAATLTPAAPLHASWMTQTLSLGVGETVTLPTTITSTAQGTYLFQADITIVEAPTVHAQAQGTLAVVDALLKLTSVTAAPAFVEQGADVTSNILAQIANVTNLPMGAQAQIALLTADGTTVYSHTTPVFIASSLVPVQYQMDAIQTAALVTGTYSVTVSLVDETGALIPDGFGVGVLGVGQQIEATESLAPAVVPPGDSVVTSTLSIQLSQTVLDSLDTTQLDQLRLTLQGSPAGRRASRLTGAAERSGPLLRPAVETPHLTALPTSQGALPLLQIGVQAADPAQSTLTVTTPHLADGSDAALITVTARDSLGQPVADSLVWVTASGVANSLTPLSGLTNASGIFTATLRTTQAEVKVVRAQVDATWLPLHRLTAFSGAVITGTVFSDPNRDNVRDSGEPGLEGVQLMLYEAASATQLKTTVSDANGAYAFTDLAPGLYQVAVAQLDEYALSGPATLLVTVGAFGLAPDNNFGHYAAGRVTGQVFYDSDQDGQSDPGEGALADVAIHAVQGGDVTTATVTDASGAYTLDLAADLPAAPANFVFNSSRFPLQEPTSAVIINHDLARGLTPLDPATYPANYDFSSGDLGSWTVSNAAVVTVISDTYNLAGYYLRIDSYNQSADSPAVTIPATTQSLRFHYFNWSTRDSTVARPLHVYVLSGEGFAVSTYLGAVNGSALQGWLPAVLDLQAFQGQTVKLRFLTDTDGYWAGRARIDNLSFNQEVPDWTFTHATYTAVISDSYNLDGAHLRIDAYNHSVYSPAFVIPPNAQSLRFDYLNWSTRDHNVSRPLYVYLLTGDDLNQSTYLGSVSGSLLEGWKEGVFDIQAFQGQMGRVHFLTDTDGYWAGRSRLDNPALYIETPSWEPSNALYVTIGEDAPTEDAGLGLTNTDFEVGLEPLDPATYPTNYDFSLGRAAVPTTTFPVNYDFATGDLTGWAGSDGTYVQVISDTYNLPGSGHHLLINSYNQSATSDSFTLAAGVQSLRFHYYNWATRDSNVARPLYVYVLSGADFGITTYLGSVSGSWRQGWLEGVLDIQAFAGQTVKLHFLSDTDGYWAGRSRIDNIGLYIETPGWAISSSAVTRIVDDVDSHPGSGNYLLLDAYYQSATSSPTLIPAGAQSLRFDYSNWATRDATVARPLYLYVLSGPDYSITTYLGSVSGSRLNGWLPATFDVQAFQGQTVKLHFLTDTDGYWAGRSRIDNLSFNVETPGWTPSSTIYEYVTIEQDTPPLNPPTGFSNGDFSQGRIPSDPATYPANYDFAWQRTPLDPLLYPPNYDFGQMRLTFDPATYPANHDFAAGVLGDWTVSNATLVEVISDTYNLDGYYLRIDGYNQSATSPAFTAPTTVQSIRFDYYNWSTRDNNVARPLHVYVLSGPTFSASTYLGAVNGAGSQGWLEGALDIQAFQGQTIKLQFLTDTDGYWAGRSRLDNITLHEELPLGWKPSSVSYDYVQIISDTYNLDGPYLRLNQYAQWANTPVFTVPEGTQSLRFDYYNWSTRDSNVARPLYIYALSGPDLSIVTLLGSVNGAEVNGWLTGVLDLQAFTGEAIQLQFLADTDGYWAGRSRIDNLSLNIELPADWRPSTTVYGYVQILSDTYSLDGPYLMLNSYGQSAETPAFEVPTTTHSLRFNYFNQTWRDNNVARPLYVYVLSGDDFGISTLIGTAEGSFNEAWKTAQFDLQNYQGQTVKLLFLVDTDGYWAGQARIDNLSLNVEVPDWHFSNAAVASVESAGGIDGGYLLLNSYYTSAYPDAFLVPTTADRLEFDYLNWSTRDANASRPLYVYAYSGDDFSVSNLVGTANGSLNEGWKSASLDMTPFRGRYIRLTFLTDTDGYWAGRSQIDNIQLVEGVDGPPLGEDNNTSHYVRINSYGQSLYSPPFTVPTDTLDLTFDYFNWATRDGNVSRPLYVYVLYGNNFEFTSYLGSVSGSYRTGWLNGALSLSAFRGQLVKLRFLTDTDGYWAGRSKIDNILLTTTTDGAVTLPGDHAGSYLAITNYNTTATSAPLDVPTDTTSVQFDYLTWSTRDSNVARPLYLYALSGPDFATSTYLGSVSGSALEGWKVGTLSLSAFQGQSIKLKFLTDTDGYWAGQSRIDNVYLLPVTTTSYTIEEINPVNYTSTTSDSVALEVFGGALFTVDFGDYAVDRYLSSVEVAPTSLTADGIAPATVTVTVRNGLGDPLPGYSVAIVAPGEQVSIDQPAGPTDAAGQVVGAVRSIVAQTVLVTARTISDNVTLADAIAVTFLPGPADADQSSLTAAPEDAPADGLSPITFTVTLRDAFGNVTPGRLVTVTAASSAPVTLTQAVTVTDAAGQVTGEVRSTTAQSVILTAYVATDHITVTQQPVVHFSSTDPALSVATITPATVVADGVTSATLSVTLRARTGDPLPGKAVAISVAGSGVLVNGQPVVGIMPLGLTGPDGSVTATLAATDVGLKTVTVFGDDIELLTRPGVTFVVGPVDADASTLTSDRASVIADGASAALVTATLYDSYGHPTPGLTVLIQADGVAVTVDQPSTTTDSQGQVTANVRSTATQTVTVTAFDQTDGLTLTQQVALSFVPGPVDAAASTIIISPTELVASGVDRAVITATLRDALGHPAAGRQVQLTASGSGNLITPSPLQTSDANGSVIWQLASTTLGVKSLTLSDLAYGVTLPAGSVTFVPAMVDPGLSSLTSDQLLILADGLDVANVTATLRDQYGNPIAGHEVAIQASGPGLTLTQPGLVTDDAGQTQATVRATQPQSVTVTAVDVTAGVALSHTLTLDFVAGAPDPVQSSITVTPTTALADGLSPIAITATLVDSLGHPLAGRAIELLLSGSDNTVLPGNPALTDMAGQVAFTLTSTRAQVQSITLRDVVSQGTLAAGAITLTPGPVDADYSVVTVSASQAPADGQSPITITIILRDAHDNPIPGVTATLALQPAGDGYTLTQPAGVSDINGQLTGSLVATTLTPLTLQATADGVTLADQPVVTFQGPDLVVSKSGPTVGIVGRVVTYTLSVVNAGWLPAQSVVLTDILPAAMQLITHTGDYPFSSEGLTQTWQLGDLNVGDSLGFELAVLVGPDAPLDGQLSNTAQVSSPTPENNNANNSASTTLTIVPGYVYAASIAPATQTAAVGAEVVYQVMVHNAGNLADAYNVAVNGLNPAWYNLTPTDLTLQPGEISYATLTVHTDVCTDAGSYPFFALVGSAGVGNTQTVGADLTLTTSPELLSLWPEDNAAIGATSALFSWQTVVSSTTSLFLREVGTGAFVEYTGAPGQLHQVEVSGLNRNSSYEWYARSESLCGSASSTPRLLQTLNGVAFSARSYHVAIARDYNQPGQVTIVNQDTVTHTVVLTLENSFPELIIGFVGDGSIDAPLLLPPGQSQVVQLAIHAQDVTQEDFPLVARLTADDGANDPIQDAVALNIHVEIPDFAFQLEEIASDPTTLVKRYRLTNLGDAVTDMLLEADVSGTGGLYLHPGMTHGYLPSGGTFEFDVIPAVDSSFTNLSGVIRASAAGVITETATSLSLPAGFGMYLGEAQDVSMEASTANWYCTNRPIINSEIVLPAGFRREDVARAELMMTFNPSSGWQQRPHDVDIFFNDNLVGELTNLIPEGLYTFPLDPAYLNEALYAPSINYIRLETLHMNGGHYVVASDMLVSICLTRYREWVAAPSQAEADAIVSSRSFLIPAPTNIDVNILAPTSADVVNVGQPFLVQVQVADDVIAPLFYNVTLTADNDNGAAILYDDGAHGDGGYRDGIYANTWTPLNPGPTTLTFHAGSCTIAGDNQITIEVQDTRFEVAVTHWTPLTGTSLLTDSIAPPPAAVYEVATATTVEWALTLDVSAPAAALTLPVALSAMRPGEVRTVSDGALVQYSGPGGSGQVPLPALSVAAQHLIAITPATQTAHLGSPAVYSVTLSNPTSSALPMTLGVAGLSADWVQGLGSLTVPAGAEITQPLTITLPAGAALDDYPFAATVVTANGGEDQAGALLTALDILAVTLTPESRLANHSAPVTYTVAVHNQEATTRTYALTLAGFASDLAQLPAAVTVGPHSVVSTVITLTANLPEGPHAFSVVAHHPELAVEAADEALLVARGIRRVGVTLAPALGVVGPGGVLTYTLEVTNLGTLLDSYTLEVETPAGWTFSLIANGQPVDSLTLRPYIFNAATLLLRVTAPSDAAPGLYSLAATARSAFDPQVSATATAGVELVTAGVQVRLTPAERTLSPTDTAVWQVTITNTGSLPDSYTLLAGGVAGASGAFSNNPVSLAPGASTQVDLTAGPFPFALPRSFPVEVKAVSLLDERVQATDAAIATFTDHAALALTWKPASQTLTNTYTTTYLLVITNTGNTSVLTQLELIGAPLNLTPAVGTIIVPPFMTAKIPTTVAAPAHSGSYTFSGAAPFGDQRVEASATLVVISTQAPEVSAGDNLTVTENSAVTFTGGFTDPDVGETHAYTWDFGDGATFSGSLTPTHTYLDDGVFLVTLVVTDSLGAVGQDSLSLTVLNVAPSVTAGSDQTVNDGAAVAFNGSFSDPGPLDSHLITWDFGDGMTVNGALTPTHTYATYGLYTATLTVADDDGAVGSDSVLITVEPLPMAVTLAPLYETVEGAWLTVTATLDNPSQLPIEAIILAWGDGAISSGALTAQHQYGDNGVYTGVITIAYPGGVATATAPIVVANVPPVVAAGPDQGVLAGEPVSFQGSYTDPGWLDSHTIEWTFGDGVGLSGALTPTHTYSVPGLYTVTLTVTDDDGEMTSDTLLVSVAPQPVSVWLPPTASAAEGAPLTITATLDNPSDVPILDITFAWGDGTLTTGLLAPSHAYGDDGVYTGVITVTYADGVVTATTTITIWNVAPAVAAGPDQTAAVGALLLFNGSYTDPGWLDTHLVSWDWGDGSVITGTLTPTHTYSVAGVYTVTLTVADDDGGVGVDSLEVVILAGDLTLGDFCAFSFDHELIMDKDSEVTCSLGASGKVDINQGLTVNGDLVSWEDRVQVAQNATILGNVTAMGSIALHQSAIVDGNAHAGGDIDLDQNSAIVGDATAGGVVTLAAGATVGGLITEGAPPPSLPPMTPPLLDITADGPDVSVSKNQTLHLLPGQYGELDVAPGGKLILSAGVYVFEKIDFEKDTFLEIDLTAAPYTLVVDVEQSVYFQARTQMTTSGAASAILFRVAGEHVQLNQQGVYLGTFLAPNGHIDLHRNSSLIGALYGERVHVHQNVSLLGAPAVALLP